MLLDSTDHAIIAALTADARASFAEIGQAVSLSAPAVTRRVDRLRAAGVIKGFTAVIDPAAVGGRTEAFVELFCTGRTTPAQIAAATRRHPAVIGAYTVSGEAQPGPARCSRRTTEMGHRVDTSAEDARQRARGQIRDPARERPRRPHRTVEGDAPRTAANVGAEAHNRTHRRTIPPASAGKLQMDVNV